VQRVEPVLLDLLDVESVAEEAVDAERDPLVLDGVALGEEAAEDEAEVGSAFVIAATLRAFVPSAQ
jgi:hypothetical protein